MNHFLSRTSLLSRHFQSTTMKLEKATFAAGCFWGVEHIYKKHFNQFGIRTKVGYTGGHVDDPDYRKVCSGLTNHAEALEIEFDPTKVSFDTLVEFFYKMHDPTTKNAQGPDVGTQYRSAIFYHTPEQKSIAEKVTAQVQERHYKDKQIVTEIVPAGKFYDAEEYHQEYLQKNPHGYECPTHFLRCMKTTSLVKRLKWSFSGNMNPHALVIGDVDNDNKNEFVIGNLSGDLAIFKGECQDGYPSYICRGLGTITCIAIGDVRNHGKNSVVVINAEGHAHIFDIPVKAKHTEQVSVDDYLRGGRRSSDTASVVAFKRMMSNSSYFATGGNTSDQVKPAPRIYDLEKSNITLKVPVNVNKVLIADIDNDKKNELILARTDRILHVFRLALCDITVAPADPKGGAQFPTFSNLVSPSSSTSNIHQLNTKSSRKGARYSLSEVNMWVFDGQISSLCTTTHPDKPDEPLLLVAQPGNTFIIIDKDGNRYNHDFTPQYEQSEPHRQHNCQKDNAEESSGMVQDETSDITDDLGNTFTRTNYIIKNWPVVDNTIAGKGQTGDHPFESGAVATEIVVGKRHLQGSSFTTNEIGMLSMDGKFSIYDLKNKTISHRDLFVTHKLFSLATLDISKPSIRSNNSDCASSVKQSDVTTSRSGTHTPLSHTSQLRYTSELDDGSSSEYDDESWDEASENEETPGCDLFVACAWNGVTYLIDWSRRREDAKIKYQLVKFAFEGRVCAFTAGLYAIDDENVPCLVYVDFEDQIYVYYDVHISTGPVNGFIDTLDDDVEEAIDRIIGIEGAIDSLIQSEQRKSQRKPIEDEELEEEEEEEGDAIDLGDGWRGITNEEECDFIKQGDSDILNLADFIHECLYDFDSMKDKLEKEMISFEKSTLSHRLLPATDIRRLSDLNISIGPNLDNEVTSDRSMIDEEEASSKYLFSATRSEESSEIYDNDIHIASWIEGSLIASSIFKEQEDTSEEEEEDLE